MTSSTSLLATLPGQYYTDPAIFALEQSRIFGSRWLAVARASDVDRPGRYRTIEVGGESVLLVRGRDGGLRAFFNVCRHRGARLCTEADGEARRSLQCPYHAWTYGFDGKLVAAPNLTNMPDVDRSAYGLVPVHLREWLGYAWICLADEPPSFEETVRDAVTGRLGDPAAIGSWQLDELRVGRRISYDVKANWKLIVENFMECYHCATIHPELTEVLPEFAQGYAAQYYVGHGAEFGPEIEGFTVDGAAGFDRLGGVDPGRDRRYYAITINPQVFLNLVPDHVIFHRMLPISAERTLVECDWLYSKEVVASGKDVSRSVELFHRVNQQDFDACERCQPAMSSRIYAHGGVLVPSEHHLGAFHSWVLDALA
ncbi:aromatic ring-hydroxylating dioxygenase subunit alpha [Amycolatopsis acidiphila]|uniref:Aromatic ring-hydroxylating dioxygenase subunit alpha n=1 Tax=Amycolatopsis acidiphila TaxID=715473 RepID=A0A558AJW5_9PSEU|nr:aromatic ring-hydroxylating dioxygenase subunit alpha [Amycolatopsis acidiphila]TVT24556.1 aromatic ring-hydroxylating dioxygenase subunit alpha [Amycolatopsis acidiphila]UIJ58500.1 aromatic ring-hydroxylating dioxygenase subunit alpha [Amycolatopsis acidiphila]GHG77151.1 (2Fe-2S) ferredoxin [Amycolatopsis acidiphila]